MLFRNRRLWRLALACVALTCLLSAAALIWSDGTTALWVLAVSTSLCAAFLTDATLRLRDISRLAQRVEDALAERESLSVGNMREGELAVLASRTEKALLQLRLANENLEREKTSLADSLADVSHQLRTPLTSLGLELELLRRNVSSKELQMRVRGCEATLDKTQWLVSALLKLARIDAGVVRLSREHIDAQTLVEDAFTPLAIAYDMADIHFSCTSMNPQTSEQESNPSFWGDAAWSREAVSNLLKNCLEHTPAGGRVEATVSEDTLACRIRIQDSGPGIPPEDLPHVFERFYRGRHDQAQDDPNPSGVGIGLSLARALVMAQGGQIRASNVQEAGRVTGARFDIAFFKAQV